VNLHHQVTAPAPFLARKRETARIQYSHIPFLLIKRLMCMPEHNDIRPARFSLFPYHLRVKRHTVSMTVGDKRPVWSYVELFFFRKITEKVIVPSDYMFLTFHYSINISLSAFDIPQMDK